MNNNVKVLKRFIAENSVHLLDGITVIDNKSFWKRIFKFLVAYRGRISIIKSAELIDGKMVPISVLNVVHFDKDGNRFMYAIKYLEGETLCFINDCESEIEHVYNLITKNNWYNRYAYANYVKYLKSVLRK